MYYLENYGRIRVTMDELHDVVIFVSNPFGFGPTGKTVALIEELTQRWKGTIVYAASSMCRETIPAHVQSSLIIEDINERDATALEHVFKKYSHPLIVSVLNRRAVKTAKALGLRAILVDSLAWMWDKIPEEYLLADTYYCFDLFEVKKKLPTLPNIKVIPPMLGKLPKPEQKKASSILLHIGGFKNPFQDELPFPYLDLLIEALSSAASPYPVTLTGGGEALTYLRKQLGKKYHIETFGRDEFLRQISSTSHFVTTSGLTATLEAFALETPTSFLPPTNLSQWKILHLLAQQGAAPSKMTWEDLTTVPQSLDTASEQDAIPIFYDLAKKVRETKQAREMFVKYFTDMLQAPPASKTQSWFLNLSQKEGCQVIIDDLLPYCKKL